MVQCKSCLGTGKVLREYKLDQDNYPLYCAITCPVCGGNGGIDDTELFVVPRAFIKDDFFVSSLFSEGEQKRLREVLKNEQLFLERNKKT